MFIRKNVKAVNSFDSKPQPVQLKGYPPCMVECFQLLRAADVQHFSLFGGAVRDADYSARHNQCRPIKDYDIRVWLPTADYAQHLEAFIKMLANVSNVTIEEVPSLGTNRIRHCLTYKGVELDISVRPTPEEFKNHLVPVEAVAIDRSSDSDVGLCSVAIDSLGRAWAKPEYILDQIMKTLTVYPNTNSERKIAYAKRMKEKFPDHVIAWTDKLDKSLLSVSRLCIGS